MSQSDRWQPSRRLVEEPPGGAQRGPHADPESFARKILLDQLTGRARSRAELATKLASRGVEADVADRLLTRFEDVGLIDDAAFAAEWVTARHHNKGLSGRALKLELQRKGVEAHVVEEALLAISAEDDYEAALELARRRLRSLSRFDEATKARRLQGLLARRGYGPGVCFGAVRDVLGEEAQSLESP